MKYALLALLLAGCAGQTAPELLMPDQFFMFVGNESRDGHFGKGVPTENEAEALSFGLAWNLSRDRSLERAVERMACELAAARATRPLGIAQETTSPPEAPEVERCASLTEEPTADVPVMPPEPSAEGDPFWAWVWFILFVASSAGCALRQIGQLPRAKKRG